MNDKIDAIALMARPVIKMSDYLKYPERFVDEREIFIVPDEFWETLPRLINKWRYDGQNQSKS